MYVDNYKFLNDLLFDVTSFLCTKNDNISNYVEYVNNKDEISDKSIDDIYYEPNKTHDVYISFNDDLYYLDSVDDEYKIKLDDKNPSILFYSSDMKNKFKIILIKRNE